MFFHMERITPSQRTEHIHYAIREVVELGKEIEKKGHKVIKLNIGDPIKYDFEIPTHILESVKKRLSESGSYTDSIGITEAKEAVKKEESKHAKFPYSEEDVVLTNGGSEAITVAIGSLVNPGENLLTPMPSYPLYTQVLNYFHGETNDYFLNEEDRWMPDLDDIRKKINDKSMGIVLINPNNPTGAVYSKKRIQSIIDIAGEHNLVVFSDEIYSKLVYGDGEFHSAASLSKDVPVVTLNGLSKSYLMPGWRAGWMVFHDPSQVMQEYKDAVKRVFRTRLSGIHPTQFAIKPALEGHQEHLAPTIKKLAERAELTYKRLNEMDGVSVVKPSGAFYAFPKLDIPITDREFVEGLLKEKHVMTVYGSGFGQMPGTKHLRVVTLAQPATLEEAYDRMADYIKKIRK